MSITNLTPSQLRRAAVLTEKIEKLQADLSDILGSAGREATTTKAASKPRKKISAAGIAKIRAAQKARWAKFRAAKGK
jgi:hypothetical protein